MSQYFGICLCIILFSAAYAGNLWNAQNFPFLSQDLFYENGTVYDQTLILTPTFGLNQTALDIQGVPWSTPATAIYYLGCNLAMYWSFGLTIHQLVGNLERDK